MQEANGMLRVVPFVLVSVGTLGLLANEFLFDWSRSTTLAFAAASLIGLVGVGIGLFRR